MTISSVFGLASVDQISVNTYSRAHIFIFISEFSFLVGCLAGAVFISIFGAFLRGSGVLGLRLYFVIFKGKNSILKEYLALLFSFLFDFWNFPPCSIFLHFSTN